MLVKIFFNNLPPGLTILKNDKEKFKTASRKYLNTNFLYSLDGFFLCETIIYNIVL